MMMNMGVYPMCGRFTLYADLNEIIERFDVGVSINSGEYQYRYNIAPSQNILSVINDGKQNRLGFLKWGLVPSWAKDASMGHKLINARSETIHEKPSFKQAIKQRRCLIIADGIYEWKRNGKNKIPMRIRLKGNHLFSMAGLWESWTSPTGEKIHSCTIITTNPNELMQSIHDRMPVILKPEHEKIWLDRSIQDINYLNQLLVPYSPEEMEAYEVSSLVNSPKNETLELIQPI
jgi:putative SOS response-associated peptidase YedK